VHIKYSSCWDVLDELKVDKTKVQVILTKQDLVDSQKMNEIVRILEIREPIIISTKTGFGVHKLRTLMALAGRTK
jgi:GTP-binding protein HflX